MVHPKNGTQSWYQYFTLSLRLSQGHNVTLLHSLWDYQTVIIHSVTFPLRPTHSHNFILLHSFQDYHRVIMSNCYTFTWGVRSGHVGRSPVLPPTEARKHQRVTPPCKQPRKHWWYHWKQCNALETRSSLQSVQKINFVLLKKNLNVKRSLKVIVTPEFLKVNGFAEPIFLFESFAQTKWAKYQKRFLKMRQKF